MKCKKCKAELLSNFKKCPVCKNKLNIIDYDLYPNYKGLKQSWKVYRDRIFKIIVFLSLASVIVNICVGGTPWSIYSVIGVYLLYQAALSYELVEISLIHRFISSISVICILLLTIKFISAPKLVIQPTIPSILFGSLILVTIYYFINFKKRRSSFIPILFIICNSIVMMLLGAFGLYRVDWSLITLNSVCLAIILFSIFFYRKPLVVEIKKRIHTTKKIKYNKDKF